MIPEIQDRIEAATASIKKKAIKGLFVKDVMSAMVTGSVFLILAGTAYGLSQIINPALAAIAVGGLVLVLITSMAVISLGSDRKK